jgi:hypothetical protein
LCFLSLKHSLSGDNELPLGAFAAMSAEKPTRLKQPSILRWVSPGADGAQLLVEPTPPKWLHVNKRKAELLEKPAEDKPAKTSHNGGRPSGNESRGVAGGAERSNRVPKGGLRLKLAVLER